MYHDYGQYASVQKAGHITIRNNWIHDASFMGVYANGVPDILFEGNTFERNGLRTQKLRQQTFGPITRPKDSDTFIVMEFTWATQLAIRLSLA